MQAKLCRFRTLSYFGFVLICLLVSTLFSPEHDGTVADGQAFDAVRRLLYVHQDGGVVRVLNLNHNVGEIATLREPGRHAIYDIRLAESRRWLWVLADDGIYRYDTRTFRPVGFEARSDTAGLRFAAVGEEACSLLPRSPQSAPEV